MTIGYYPTTRYLKWLKRAEQDRKTEKCHSQITKDHSCAQSQGSHASSLASSPCSAAKMSWPSLTWTGNPSSRPFSPSSEAPFPPLPPLPVPVFTSRHLWEVFPVHKEGDFCTVNNIWGVEYISPTNTQNCQWMLTFFIWNIMVFSYNLCASFWIISGVLLIPNTIQALCEFLIRMI